MLREHIRLVPYLLIISFIMLFVPGADSIRAGNPITLKLAHDSPPTSQWQIGALKFAELVNKKTNGEVKIEVYPAGQLGDLRELMELTQAGTVDFCFQTLVAGSFVPILNVLGLPFLFDDRSQMSALYKGPLGKRMLDAAEQSRLKGLLLNGYTYRSPMNNKRPLKTLDDFKGLKIRLMQIPIHIESYKALGCAPVALPWSELYMAAKTGAVDGFENGITVLVSGNLHEVGKYFSTLPVLLNATIVFASLKTWNEKLDASQRKAILDCIPEVDETLTNVFDRFDETNLKKVKDYGVQVYEGPFDLKAFRTAVKPVYDKWVPTLPVEGQNIVKEIQRRWK